MFTLAIAIMAAANDGGQQVFSANGTFVVPAGVTSIAAVVIGSGGANFDNDGGAGGGLSYNNAIAVTPGESLTVVAGLGATCRVHRSGTTLIQANSASGLTAGTANTTGGATSFAGRGGSSIGGGAGTYTANATGFVGTSLLGTTPGGGSTYGRGGDGNTGSGREGGAVRIIWGAGRAYPATNVGDV